MRYLLLIMILLSLEISKANSQEINIGCDYGRFWSPYKFIDYGSNARNQARYNYNFFPSIVLNKYYPKKISAEAGLFFTPYRQYYSVREYLGAYGSTHICGHIIFRMCYSFSKSKKVETRIKGGLGIGIGGMYKAEYTVSLLYPTVELITQGTEKNNYTPIFPMLSTGLDISYKIAKRFKFSLAANYQKGIIKITEYDIHYNDGSGNNDQRAKQWGTGDFYGIQLGLRYVLRDENGNKFRKDK